MTEEDTFQKLRQIPFDDMFAKYMKMGRGFDYNNLKIFLYDHGWDIREFTDIVNERYGYDV